MTKALDLRKQLLSKIEELPTLPAVVPRLLGILTDDETSPQEIGAVIARDPTLTTKVLRVANSAYYGFPREVSSIEKAIILIGRGMIKSLALSIPLMHGLPLKKGATLLSPRGLWIHSVAVATLMPKLQRGKSENSEEDWFIVGLLHDVGKILFAEFLADDFERVLQKIRVGEEDCLFRAEREVLGFDHAEAAALLLSRWNLPARIIAPIQNHHLGNLSENLDPRCAAALQVANHLSQKAGFLGEGNRDASPLNEQNWKILGPGSGETDGEIETLRNLRSEIEGFYTAVF